MGSHFVEFLLTQDIQTVVIVDKLTYAGNIKNIESSLKNPRCRFYLADICEPLIEHVIRMEQVDAIVNFAAETHVDRSITNPRAFLETDIMGLFNLAYWGIKTKIKLFLQVSTDEVYGPILKGEADETFPLNPTSPYSASKAAAELLLQSYHKTYGLPLVIVRCCNNFGPRQYPEKLIPMAITRLLDDKPILLHGEGQEVREWIYVKDCIKEIVAVLKERHNGEIFNIGSGFRLTNLETTNEILLFLGVAMQRDRLIEFVNPRPNNDFRYAINSQKLGVGKYAFDYFDALLRETIKWYDSHLDWWEGKIDLDSNFYKKGESLK
uniref:Putative GDP-mannose 4,6-dehydratase n=1 Tax=viral metagenome TaxID=1070528 RepID=A0A6M3ITZ9_9ZZZZ